MGLGRETSVELRRDVELLHRRRTELIAQLAELDQETHSRRIDAAYRLTTEYPGLQAVGHLLALDPEERETALLAATADRDARETVDTLLELFSENTDILGAFVHVMPERFHAPESEAWERYREYLQKIPMEPIWGDPRGIGIHDLYVPPRYTYEEAGDDEKDAPKPTVKTDPSPRIRKLLKKQVSAEPEIVFVTGGPGIGKSSFMQMLAAELAQDPDQHPVFVRLRLVNPERPIMSELRRVLREDGFKSVAESLHSTPGLTLLLDGYDELAQATRNRMVAFFYQVRELLTGRGPVRRVVLSGRDTLFTLFAGNDAAFPTGSHLIRLQPFAKAQVTKFSERWNRLSDEHFDGGRFLTGKKRGLSEIASQPLMLYMLARMEQDGVDVNVDVGEEAGHAAVYAQLIDWTCERHEDLREGDWSRAQMRRFLRLAGFVAWLGGSEVLHRTDLEDAIHDAGLSKGLDDERFKAERTILSFTFRSPKESYWEFTHKSFGEYLAAEYLGAVCRRITERAEDEFGELAWRCDNAGAAREWIRAFGPALVTSEIEELMVSMLKSNPQESGSILPALRERLTELYPRLVREEDGGAVIETARGQHRLPAEVRGHSLANLFALAGLESPFEPELSGPGLFEIAYSAVNSVVPWLEDALRRTWGRVSLRGRENSASRGKGLLGCALPFIKANGADLEKARLEFSMLYKSDFSGAKLKGAEFMGSILVGADLSNADLSNADLGFVNLEGANLEGANLKGTILEGTT